VLADQSFADVYIAAGGEVAGLTAPEEAGAAMGDVQDAKRLGSG